MLKVSATDEWRTVHQGATIGILEISGLLNNGTSDTLNQRKRKVEAELRERYAGHSRSDFLALPVMSDYYRYYKHFEKTYHVQLQLESLVCKGKNFPNVSPLVDSNFIAELQTLILTAGHDVAKLAGSIVIDVSRAGDCITQMNGAMKEVRTGDMLMRDEGGVCCTIIYGQDIRSPISASTSHAMFVAYAPHCVAADVVMSQLDGILGNIQLFSDIHTVQQKTLIKA